MVQQVAVEGGLGLIDHQQVGASQQLVRHRRRRGQIDADELGRPSDRRLDRLDRQLQLQDQGRVDPRRQLFGQGAVVGAGRDHDLVLALGIDRDQGHAGRGRGVRHDPGDIDIVGQQQGHRLLGHAVAPDPADQTDLGAEPPLHQAPRRQRLVGALAARMPGQGRPRHGFAGARQARRCGDEIQID